MVEDEVQEFAHVYAATRFKEDVGWLKSRLRSDVQLTSKCLRDGFGGVEVTKQVLHVKVTFLHQYLAIVQNIRAPRGVWSC